jgi:hypothetical protein
MSEKVHDAAKHMAAVLQTDYSGAESAARTMTDAELDTALAIEDGNSMKNHLFDVSQRIAAATKVVIPADPTPEPANPEPEAADPVADEEAADVEADEPEETADLTDALADVSLDAPEADPAPEVEPEPEPAPEPAPTRRRRKS